MKWVKSFLAIRRRLIQSTHTPKSSNGGKMTTRAELHSTYTVNSRQLISWFALTLWEEEEEEEEEEQQFVTSNLQTSVQTPGVSVTQLRN